MPGWVEEPSAGHPGTQIGLIEVWRLASIRSSAPLGSGSHNECTSSSPPFARRAKSSMRTGGRAKATPGSAQLGDAQRAALERVRSIHAANQQHGGRLVVRGHASAAEDAGLAQARADAVVAELLKLGVGRKQLELRSFGAGLLITNAADEDSRNCRVDFEVIE